ncbi:MAG: NADH-quinone oxidoreductase subunit I [Elusimicrobia bacterium]|nr:NADH-quinone oxidoreductase subunit I [Elusimicrobiota bacterium]
MISYFKEVGTAFWNTCKGLKVTLGYLFKPAITVSYPTEKLVPFEKFRGALLFDTNTCIACNLCVKACPSDCIALKNAKNEQGKTIAKVDWYTIDFGKCNFCRLCEEACPTKPKSVWHSLDYELMFQNRDEMVRSWRKEDDYVGVYFDRGEQKFKPPTGQVPIQDVPARR